jgi:hypothetical protein
LVRLGGDVSTLLGPERTTIVLLFQRLGQPPCGGWKSARHGLVSYTAGLMTGFGVGLWGCGLVVC